MSEWKGVEAEAVSYELFSGDHRKTLRTLLRRAVAEGVRRTYEGRLTGPSIGFVVEGPPVPTPRPVVVHNHAFVGSPAWRDYKQAVTDGALEAFARRGGEPWPIDQGYQLRLGTFFGDCRARDLDNTSKGPADALNKVAYGDDRQVDRLIVDRGVDRERPRTEVSLTVMGPSVLLSNRKR